MVSILRHRWWRARSGIPRWKRIRCTSCIVLDATDAVWIVAPIQKLQVYATAGRAIRPCRHADGPNVVAVHWRNLVVVGRRQRAIRRRRRDLCVRRKHVGHRKGRTCRVKPKLVQNRRRCIQCVGATDADVVATVDRHVNVVRTQTVRHRWEPARARSEL